MLLLFWDHIKHLNHFLGLVSIARGVQPLGIISITQRSQGNRQQAEPEVLQATWSDWDSLWIPLVLFSTKYIYFLFVSVLLTLWKGASKTMTASQPFCSPGEHDGKDLCIIKMAAHVLCSTAGWIDISVAAPCLQILATFLKALE